MRFYTVESIGRTRSLTPEGFMLCKDAVLARTGTQLYAPGETPVPDHNGDYVQIERDPEEVFNADTIASAQGKPVVNEHPVDSTGRCDVTVDNWRDLAIGTILNARQGTGIDNDVLMADLLITDQDAIDLITVAGKRELSCGYDADYLDLGRGHGKQTNIRINHVALVDQGRCGPRCAIGDTAPRRESMKLNLRAIRRAFRDGDEKALEDELKKTGDADEDEDDEKNGNGNPELHTHVHLGETGDQGGEVAETIGRHESELEELWQANQMEASAIESLMGGGGGETEDAWRKFRDAKYPHRDARRKRMGIFRDNDDKDDDDKTGDQGFRDPPAAGGMEQGMRATAGRELELEAPAGTQGDALRRAHDSALLEDSWADTMSRAEIIMPGVRLPTFDRAAKPMATVDQLCAFRARVLDGAYAARPEVRELIDEVTAGRWRDAKSYGCARCRDTFISVATTLRRINNSSRTVSTIEQIHGGGFAAVGGTVASINDWQKHLDEQYARK